MTLKSMTGFGRGAGSFGGLDFTIDIKTVNHRFFDFSARLYKDYAFLEEPIRKRVAQQITRGKTDVYFHTEKSASAAETVAEIDNAMVRVYLEAAGKLTEEFGVSNDLSVSRLLSMPNVLILRQAEAGEEEIANAVLSAVDQALSALMAMRETEGQRLKSSLLENLAFIQKSVDKIDALAPASIEAYRQRLEEKIRETLQERSVDDARVLTEVALFADRVAVDEETVRLRSHLSQFTSLLEQGGPVGKKLDFLVQEMNREINTVGSKCSSIEITRTVVEVKAEIEKIREQIQNIE